MTFEEIETFILKNFGGAATTFGYNYTGDVPLQQISDEIASLIYAIQDSKVEKYLEIGSGQGGSAYLMHLFFGPDLMVMVDIAPDPTRIARLENAVEITGSSLEPDVVKQVEELAPFDLLFVDGDHDYHAAKTDVENYGQFLSPGGLLVLHDTKSWPGVTHLMSDMLNDSRYHVIQEFVSAYSIAPLGLGLFRKI